MPSSASRIVFGACAYLAVATALVHSTTGPTVAQKTSKTPEAQKSAPKKGLEKGPTAPSDVRYGTDKLPAPVIEMREAILAAVRSGRIDELTVAIQMNELKPDFGAGADPAIAHLKSLSADGSGAEVLAALAEILDAGYVTLPLGRDVENNKLFVWPYFAEVAIDRLSPAQQVELLRLVTPQEAKAMQESRRYTWWRIAIGADGVWHSFVKTR